MKPEVVKSFVTHYLHGLSERTRRERNGTKWGLDWVVYNLGLARFGKPVRLPFIRSGGHDYAKAKVEAEFGIDLAFLSDDGAGLFIFVLKDEPLTNKTWTTNDFDRDLRMAMAPELSAEAFTRVASVTVVLAYNKDDQQNGISLYDRLVSNAPPTLKGSISLRFVRWNLSDLVQQTIAHILSPSLVPERFFGQLSYLTAQVADFTHCSDPWEQQLLPNWRRFIADVLGEPGGNGSTLIPVALIILKHHAINNASFSTGWIDLIEWAVLALWDHYLRGNAGVKLADVRRFWIEFYVSELQSFYRSNIEALSTENAIDQLAYGSYVGAAAAGCTAFWHIGRLGLLSLEASDGTTMRESQAVKGHAETCEIAEWLATLVSGNACSYRPLLDIHHIELFLLSECFRVTSRLDDLASYLGELQSRLFLRRLGANPLPFLDGANSLQSVFEQVATKPSDSLVLTQSSYFVLCLLELCCLLPDQARDELIPLIHRHLVLGALDEGDPGDQKPLDLMSWIPPMDWGAKVFRGTVQDGDSVVVHRFADARDASAVEILAVMRSVVAQMRNAQSFTFPDEIPRAALALACIKYKSPLPPEFWRQHAFPLTNVVGEQTP